MCIVLIVQQVQTFHPQHLLTPISQQPDIVQEI